MAIARPAQPWVAIEAAIALSILFLGPEILRARRGGTSFSIRHPWVVAFAFELLPAYVVGSLGAFWVIQRVALM